MRSDLNDIPAVANEARRMALHYAMSIEIAEKGRDDRADDMWLTASNLAMDARGAALMTIDSALMATCAGYRMEHDEAGYVDEYEDEPGGTLRDHDCPRCTGLQCLAQNLRSTLGKLWRKGSLEITATPDRFQEVRNLHNILLGQVHLAIGLAAEHARGE